MFISSELRDRVNNRIRECLDKAADHYRVVLPFPDVSFDLTGTSGGVAYTQEMRIRLNGQLFLENTESYFARTIPHEVAHLICGEVYPHTLRRSPGGKRELHGPHWQEVMVVLGVSPSRCHSMDVTNTRIMRSNSRRHVYTCNWCNKEVTVSPTHHQQLIANPNARYHCRGSRITYTRDL